MRTVSWIFWFFIFQERSKTALLHSPFVGRHCPVTVFCPWNVNRSDMWGFPFSALEASFQRVPLLTGVCDNTGQRPRCYIRRYREWGMNFVVLSHGDLWAWRIPTGVLEKKHVIQSVGAHVNLLSSPKQCKLHTRCWFYFIIIKAPKTKSKNCNISEFLFLVNYYCFIKLWVWVLIVQMLKL